jgi:eukaryotic-like serine/threonine-protein kinase
MDESITSTESMEVARPEARIGSYRVLEPLGIGGMSSVFRAVHAETNQEVALKVLTRSLAKNATLLQRFLREARSAEALQHPNIVAIYDRGIDSGRHYLALEYVAGGDFHDYVQRRGPLSLVEAIAVVKSVAAGLKYAANQGLIHRDIKPSNILRSKSEQIKIIDLGLALQNEFEDERVTREGTTVGTVDYMAPEQARDSRATSIQSDMYSLGCTFYYLLTGVPPYPGGDITDKLTRHAKNPPPDACDLRPDLPVELSAILLKLMAKRPEDRFASYDELTSAIEAVPLRGGSEAPGITFAPVSGPSGAVNAGYGFDVSKAYASASPYPNGSTEATIPLASLVELAGEDAPNAIRERTMRGQASQERPLLQREVSESLADSAVLRRDSAAALEPALPTRQSIPGTAWIIPGVFLCAALVVLLIGVVQFMGTSDGEQSDLALADNRAVDRGQALSPSVIASGALAGRPALNDGRRRPPAGTTRLTQPQAPVKWDEPPDFDAHETTEGGRELSAGLAKYLPDWARLPIPDRIDGPFVVVRRIADSSDSTIVSSLHRALDGHIGGTVELADEGPLAIEDFRVSGETRLIRARSGVRPIVRIDGSSQEAVRSQSAVVVLKGKDLTLDGIDLIVDVHDVSRTQTALFLCAGSNLTVRNCSITIVNQTAGVPFSLLRTETGGPRPTHVRFERCLIRGSFAESFRLSGGPCEVVLRDSVILAGGGPVVRLAAADAAPYCRIYFAESLVAGPGPIIDWTKKAVGTNTKALEVRALGSVFGRLHGAGIASVLCSNDSIQTASQQINWFGEENLFAGWKGFFACGQDQTVTVDDLAAARSTWNGTDMTSREILASWGHPENLAGATPADFSSFVPTHRAILERAARPRAGLYEKALGSYSDPAVPDPIGWAFDSSAAPPPMPAVKGGLLPPEMTNMRGTGINPRGTLGGPSELIFNTEAAPWRGDLGAFLRDQIAPTMTAARVRVQGTGAHRFTPVKLPRGLRLEIKVEPYSQAEPPSWLPQEGATGTALIELQEGALVVANLVVRHEATARLEHLIHVEDGHLVLWRCQLVAPTSSDSTGDLIAFRSVTTQPRPANLGGPLFTSSIDRPVCRLIDCVLITGGRAVQAELGRGLVALSNCAVAAGVTAIELTPAKVARQRFVETDLVLDRCTLTSERTIVRVDSWPGLAPGPDRPWLITSRGCAFLGMNVRNPRETLLLRCDAQALASGTVMWQARDDAAEVDWFLSVGDGPLPSNRSRDVQQQWVQFWGRTHMGRVTGPRGAGSQPSVRFRDRLRPGQAVEPANLILDASFHPHRQELTVGADLSNRGSNPGSNVGRGPGPSANQQARPPL